MAEIRKPDRATAQNPGGVALGLSIRATGELFGSLEYNLDEFDAGTVADWIADYRRLVADAVADPDRPWRSL
jgi:hypothetical protein